MKKILLSLLLLIGLSATAQIQPYVPYRTNGNVMVKDSSLAVGYFLIPTFTSPSLGSYADRWGSNFGINRSNSRLSVRGNGAFLEFPSFTEVQSMIAGSGVTSITGTANQVIASSSTGAVTLSLPQSIGTANTVTFRQLNIDAAAGTSRDIQWKTAGSGRWSIRTASNAETGSNAGSDFQIIARSDADATIFTPLSIVRSTGQVTIPNLTAASPTFTGTPTSTTAAQGTNTTQLATTAFTTTGLALKQNLVTLTTTGTSGAATFNQSTGALNIPQYAGGGSSYTFSNGLTNVSSSVTLGGDIVSPTVLGLTGTNSINISGGTGVSNSGFFNIGAGSGSTNIIGYTSSGSARSIAFSNTAMTVSDAISNKGLIYAGNYGANFTDLSLITKKYADSLALWTRSGTNAIRPTKTDDAISVTNAAQASQFSTNIDGINGVTIASTTANAAVISNSSASNPPVFITNNNSSGPLLQLRSAAGANRIIVQSNGDIQGYSDISGSYTDRSLTDRAYVNSRGSAYNYTASGNGSSTAIVIPHGLTGISGTSAVVPSAKNSASSGWSYATIDATNVTINYTVAPVSGTNNLSYSIFIKP